MVIGRGVVQNNISRYQVAREDVQSWALTLGDQLTDELIDRYRFSSCAEMMGDVVPSGAVWWLLSLTPRRSVYTYRFDSDFAIIEQTWMLLVEQPAESDCAHFNLIFIKFIYTSFFTKQVAQNNKPHKYSNLKTTIT